MTERFENGAHGGDEPLVAIYDKDGHVIGGLYRAGGQGGI